MHRVAAHPVGRHDQVGGKGGLLCSRVRIASHASSELPPWLCFSHGGIAFTLKDANGRHLVNAANGKAFFLSLETLAE